MAKQHYKKELVSNAIHDRNGQAIPFEGLAEDMGVIAVDPEANEAEFNLAEDLAKYDGSMGVISITEEEYEELKKNLRYETRSSRIKQQSALPSIRPFTPASAVPEGLAASHAEEVAKTNAQSEAQVQGQQLPVQPREDSLAERLQQKQIEKAERTIAQNKARNADVPKTEDAAPLQPAMGQAPALQPLE